MSKMQNPTEFTLMAATWWVCLAYNFSTGIMLLPARVLSQKAHQFCILEARTSGPYLGVVGLGNPWALGADPECLSYQPPMAGWVIS